MQHARVNMAEHAVAQAVAVEQRAKLDDIIGEVLRRHRGVLYERDRLGAAFGVAQQPHRFFTHVIDALDAVEIVTELIADYAALTLRHQQIQPRTERAYLLLDQRAVVACELHNVQAEHLFIRHVGNQLAHRMPDDILTRQIQDFRVHRFHRQRLSLHHKRRVAQRGVEGVIFDVYQTAYFRDRRNVEPRLGDKGQRALSAAQDARQVEGLHIVAKDMTQIVAGQEAVQLWKLFQN